VVGSETGVSGAADDGSTAFRVPVEAETGDAQFNPRRDTNRAPDVEAFLYEPLAEYDPAAESFVPVLAADWSTRADHMTVSLRSDYRWHEVTDGAGNTLGGQPVTASDLVRQLRFDEAFGAAYWDVVAGVSVAKPAGQGGGGTVRIDFDGDVNLDVLAFDVLTQHLSHSPTYFAGETDSSVRSLVINPENAGPPVGTGPFKHAGQDADRISLERAAGHPATSDVNWGAYDFESEPSEDGILDGLADSTFAGTREAHVPGQFRDAAGRSLADSYEEVTKESAGGWGVLLNHQHPHLEDRKFRKAIAHVFSSTGAVESMTASLARPISLQTGLSPQQIRRYLDGELGKFEAYGDEKRAGELLADLGFFRNWEQWNDPRGGPLTLGFLGTPDPTQGTAAAISASEPAWYYGVQEFQQQLNDFFRDQGPGILDSWYTGDQGVVVGATEGFADVGNHNDIFAFLPARQWGHMSKPHPYHTFRADLLLREAADLGFGPVVEVPPYADPGGPEEEVDIREKLAALRRASSEDEERRLVRELAWVVNESIPYLQGYYRPSVSFLNDRGWTFPDTEELTVDYPSTHLPRTGDIQAED